MLDLVSAGQYYTSDYLKDTGLINSGSFGKLYALIRDNNKYTRGKTFECINQLFYRTGGINGRKEKDGN